MSAGGRSQRYRWGRATSSKGATGDPRSCHSSLARNDPLAFALLALTGLVDAVSFLGLGHVFTANMTGVEPQGFCILG